MIDKLDLWGNVTANKGSADSVLSLIQEQAGLLETKTNGKVKADFSRVHYEYKTKQNYLSSMASLLSSVSQLVGPLAETTGEMVEVDERQDLEDASHFYQRGKYKFEIYNDKYKFRIFILDYQSVFPIKLEVEYGVLEDKVVTNNVKSIDELTSLLRSVLASNKVRFIIQKMMDLDNK